MLPVIIISLIILGIESIIGIIANGLIIVVHCTEWIRSRKLTSCDMILTSLGISRFFLQWTMFIYNIFFVLSPVMNGACAIWRNLYIFCMYLNTLSLWFATWLSVFYCMKIANFSQPFFLWLKRRISGLVPRLLMSSFPVSLVTCLLSVNVIDRKNIGNSTNNLSGNTRVECSHNVNSSSGHSILHMLGYSFPFFIFLVSAVLLITSLWRHTKRMEKNTNISRDTITDAHVSVIKGLIAFIFFYISYFVATVLFLLNIFAHGSLYFSWFCVLVAAAYPSGHSVILILGNPKLKTVAVRALNYAKCWLRDEAS
ncbi:taste receptor type 2 member 1-like [Gopherus flavomarginatus]|uniref:taste receptor type 2 member 1-like n=1 Tax=Gopherus flavomarginatus TaxID=286002 RepID=UPI0021CC0FDB|nr:taste receptor type 2 member 1-like [Gopherus flavomarginatus]